MIKVIGSSSLITYLIIRFIYYADISLATILALARQSGIPPPGWTLPPTKYKFFTLLRKFGCLKKAEKIGISHWDELQNSNDDSGFVIDDVWEEE